MSALLAFAFDDGGVFLVDDDALGLSEIVKRDVLQLDAEVLGDATSAGENRDVFEHCFAAVAKARSLDGCDLQRAAELVDNERRERLALDVFGDDQERFAGLCHLLEKRQHVLETADFLLVNQDVGVLKNRLEVLGIRHEVRREVALVELHAFDDVEGRLDALGFFNGDRAVLADLVHRISDNLADGGVPVRGNGGDLSDLVAILDLLADLGEFRDDGFNGFAYTALEAGRVGARGHVLQAFAINRFGKQGGRGGSVTGDVACLAGDFADELSAHVFIGVFELDFLGDGHAVLGDGGAAEFFVENYVATGGPKSGLHGFRQLLDAAEQRMPRGFVKRELFGCHSILTYE